MTVDFEMLNTQELRARLLHESKKFSFALQIGSSIGDLQNIRTNIKVMTEILERREKTEILATTSPPPTTSVGGNGQNPLPA